VYLFGGRIRALPVADITAVSLEESRFERVSGFDLQDFWARWCERHARSQTGYEVTISASPAVVPHLASRAVVAGGCSRADQGSAGDTGAGSRVAGPVEQWVTLDLVFASLEEARGELLQFGAAVKVLSPRALRHSMLDYAQRTADLYSQDS
jgi:hypothetical protein